MPAGQPGKYTTHVQPYLDKISRWIKEGDTETIIARRLGIGNASWYNYKNEHPELVQAVVAGDQDFGLEIRDALRKRAIGYEYEETTERYERGPNGNKISTSTTKKHVAPDVGAIKLYMVFARMLSDEDLKEAQIEKIRTEVSIMRKTGQIDTEDKVAEYLDRLDTALIEEVENDYDKAPRVNKGTRGVVKTNPLMKKAEAVIEEVLSDSPLETATSEEQEVIDAIHAAATAHYLQQMEEDADDFIPEKIADDDEEFQSVLQDESQKAQKLQKAQKAVTNAESTTFSVKNKNWNPSQTVDNSTFSLGDGDRWQ